MRGGGKYLCVSILRSRFRGLFIPYVLWNIIMILATICVEWGHKNILGASVSPLAILQDHTLWDLFYLVPANFPLWFMRDLLCMSLISPLLYIFIKYTRVYGVILLYIAYLFNIQTSIPGFAISTIFYFVAGCYFALNRKSLLTFALRIKRPAFVITSIALIIITYFNTSPYYRYMMCITIPFGIVSLFNLADIASQNSNWRKGLQRLAPYSFFIYVSHLIYIQPWMKGVFARVTTQYPYQWLMIFLYFLIPFAVATVCILLYHLINKISPTMLGILIGQRTSRHTNGSKL